MARMTPVGENLKQAVYASHMRAGGHSQQALNLTMAVRQDRPFRRAGVVRRRVAFRCRVDSPLLTGAIW